MGLDDTNSVDLVLNATPHAKVIHRLRRKPLADFTVQDLRIMIGQNIGLPFLVPLAVERLEAEPLAAGDFYPGDLLASVLRVNESFWQTHPDSLRRIRHVIDRLRELAPSLDDVDRQTVCELLDRFPLGQSNRDR